MKLFLKTVISTNLFLFPVSSDLINYFPVHVSQKEDIQWIYKSKDGMIYRRKFNYTSDSWIGKWEICMEEKKESSKIVVKGYSLKDNTDQKLEKNLVIIYGYMDNNARTISFTDDYQYLSFSEGKEFGLIYE